METAQFNCAASSFSRKAIHQQLSILNHQQTPQPLFFTSFATWGHHVRGAYWWAMVSKLNPTSFESRLGFPAPQQALLDLYPASPVDG